VVAVSLPIVLGLILGGMFEENIRLSVRLARGNYWVFLQRPISAVLVVAAVASVGLSLWSTYRTKQKESE